MCYVIVFKFDTLLMILVHLYCLSSVSREYFTSSQLFILSSTRLTLSKGQSASDKWSSLQCGKKHEEGTWDEQVNSVRGELAVFLVLSLFLTRLSLQH